MPHNTNESDSLQTNRSQRDQSRIDRIDGQVRIRSNVCTRPNDWHLVPGDMLSGCDVAPHQMTEKQRKEKMYYEPCCLCNRTIYQINEEGCDHPVCRKQGIPSKAEVEQRKTRIFGEPSEIDPLAEST